MKSDYDLASLDTNLRTFIEEYRKGQITTTEFTKKHISEESKRNEAAVKYHITQVARRTEITAKLHTETIIRSVAKQKEDTVSDAAREKLLRSLKFDRMNERRNQVSSSHPNTCTWILRDGSEGCEPIRSTHLSEGGSDEQDSEYEDDEYESDNEENESGDEEYQSEEEEFQSDAGDFESEDEEETSYGNIGHGNLGWDSFSDWLRSTETIYWISGKPGSGKSTVMRYIISQPKTREYLNLWKSDPTVVSHYFWRPGTTMQQSIKGLLCSLLHQLLAEDQLAIDAALSYKNDLSQKDTDSDWSEEELQNVLEQVISRYAKPIAMFLDGLDEVSPKDGVRQLLQVVDRLKECNESTGNIKICLASRPEPLLSKLLGVYPKLQLEQLNRPDLLKYAKDHICIPDDYIIIMKGKFVLHHGNITYSQRKPPSRYAIRAWLIKSLVWKAEGVFLWLCLTVATLRKALDEDETVEDLQYRIESLPKDLVDLYEDMWARANNDSICHMQRAAEYLQLVLCGERGPFSLSLNLFDMMAATTPDMTELILQSDLSQPDIASSLTASLVSACEETRRDVISRCAGFITCPAVEGDDKIHVGEHYRAWYGEKYKKMIPYALSRARYAFLHRTVRDFLKDTKAGDTILSRGKFSGSLDRLQLVEAHLVVCRLVQLQSPIPVAASGPLEYYLPASHISNFLEFIRYSNEEAEDTRVKSQVLRLLSLCEQLFYRRMIQESLTSPVFSIELRATSQEGSYTWYEASVNEEHDFLFLVTESCDIVTVSNHLIPLLLNRRVDGQSLSRILLLICWRMASTENGQHKLSMNIQKSLIAALLDMGASPSMKVLKRCRCHGLDCHINTLETTYQALMTSCWYIFLSFGASHSYLWKSLELFSILPTLGADVQENIYTTISVSNGHVRFEAYRPEYIGLFENRTMADVSLVMAYPVSTLLGVIVQMYDSENPSLDNLIPESWKTGQTMLGHGSLAAVADLSELRGRETLMGPPDLFWITKLFPLRPETRPGSGLLRLISFAERCLLESGKDRDDVGEVPPVLVPPDILEDAERDIEKLSRTEVPIKERRREFRERLGICTPLEEPDWQLTDYISPLAGLGRSECSQEI